MRASTTSITAWLTPGSSRPEPHPHFIWRVHHGSAKIRQAQIREGSQQGGRVGDAAAKEGHTQGWTRSTRCGKEPQAGNRNRTIRGTGKGSEGATKALLGTEVLRTEIGRKEVIRT